MHQHAEDERWDRQKTREAFARFAKAKANPRSPEYEQLRSELTGLSQKGLIVSDGPLDRRGVEVDHDLYEPQEGRKKEHRNWDDVPSSPAISREPPAAPSVGPASAPTRPDSPTAGIDGSGRLAALEASCAALRTENHELRSELDSVRHEVERIASDLQKLRDALGA